MELDDKIIVEQTFFNARGQNLFTKWVRYAGTWGLYLGIFIPCWLWVHEEKSHFRFTQHLRRLESASVYMAGPPVLGKGKYFLGKGSADWHGDGVGEVWKQTFLKLRHGYFIKHIVSKLAADLPCESPARRCQPPGAGWQRGAEYGVAQFRLCCNSPRLVVFAVGNVVFALRKWGLCLCQSGWKFAIFVHIIKESAFALVNLFFYSLFLSFPL